MGDLVRGLVAKVVGGVIVGAIVGWSASALTIAGRVDAVEKTLARIESRLDAVITKREK
jgi:hypothetical protein